MGNEEFSCVITCVPQGIVLYWETIGANVVFEGKVGLKYRFVYANGGYMSNPLKSLLIFTGRYATPEETIEYWMTRKSAEEKNNNSIKEKEVWQV